MELNEICADFIPDNEDKSLVNTLLKDAAMTAEYADEEELYFAYIKVLEEYVYFENTSALRSAMIQYWNDMEEERERNCTPH